MPHTAETAAAVLPAHVVALIPVPVSVPGGAPTVSRALTTRRHIDLGRVSSAVCR
ncbi:putative leader peptide [Streptomyces sp. NPDC091292]|uniref:putative leader peptide n=1 Tax=Streptomyces sp. NPDC091292 TaxID=3365991 RepID=UPI003825E9E9